MVEEYQIAAYEGGALRVLNTSFDSREAVLALPLNRLLVRMVRLSADEDVQTSCEATLRKMSPFPDEALTVGYELVHEDESGRVVIAAALPESATDDIAEALDAAKLTLVRIDMLVLGQLRGIWNTLGDSQGRRLLLFRSVDCLSALVLDGDRPSSIRAIDEANDIRREVMLSLLEAEDFCGAKSLEEIVVIESDASDVNEEGEPAASPTSQDFDVLSSFAPLRRITVGADAALVGVAERAAEEGGLNALPESWREMLEETRFKHKMVKWLAIAGGIWFLIVATLFGVPIAYGFMTDYQKSLSRQHARQYNEVKEMKAKVDLIHKYSDHARGALEIMKALSDRLPEGITLNSWTYKRDEGVRVVGDAETAEAVYKFKDEMDSLAAGEGEDAEHLFGIVNLNGPNASKSGYRFDIDCQYGGEEEE